MKRIIRNIILIIIISTIFIKSYQSEDNSDNNEPIWIFEGEAFIFDIDMSFDGKFTVIGGDDLVVLDNFNKTILWKDKAKNLDDVTFSPDGEYFVASNMNDVYLYQTTSKKPIWNFSNNLQGGAWTNWNKNNGISYNGSYIVARLIDGIYFFEKESSVPKWSVPGDFNVVDMCQDGRYIAANIKYVTGSILTHDLEVDGHTLLWSKDSPIPVRDYTSDVGGTGTLDISPDGEFIASEWGFYVAFLSTESDETLWKYPTHGMFESIETSYNGEYIIVGNDDKDVHFFSNQQKGLLWKYETEQVVYDVDISMDGKYLIGGNIAFYGEDTKDSKFYFFEKSSKNPKWIFNSSCQSVSISHDGKYIAIGTADNFLYLFYNDINVEDTSNTFEIEIIIIVIILITVILILVWKKFQKSICNSSDKVENSKQEFTNNKLKK